MKKTRKERGWLKKTFKQAMDKELREHKSSFIVFYILRALVIVSLVRQIILDNYEGAFFCILTIVLLYVPSWVQAGCGSSCRRPWKLRSSASFSRPRSWERSTPSMSTCLIGTPCSTLSTAFWRRR